MASKTTTAKLKENLKEAILETFEENSDTIKNLLGEVLEDLALKSAIRVGVKSRKVSRQAINALLQRST
jgi:hypothetical protein